MSNFIVADQNITQLYSIVQIYRFPFRNQRFFLKNDTHKAIYSLLDVIK